MNSKGQIYHYCANPLCAFIRISLIETGFNTVYAVTGLIEAERFCPYCDRPLARTCPRCGRIATSRPLHFCPVCGANLLGEKMETYCAVCSKPMRVDSRLQDDVPCCSERCLRHYLLEKVKTCDQCGLRFHTIESNGTSFIGLTLSGQDERLFDFCSTSCLEKYCAEHDVLLHSALTDNLSIHP